MAGDPGACAQGRPEIARHCFRLEEVDGGKTEFRRKKEEGEIKVP